MEKVFAAIKENRSLSDNGEYLAYIRDILNRHDLTGFKHHPVYNLILEHTMHEQGAGYLDVVIKQTPELVSYMDKFRINDIVGNAELDITGRPAFHVYGSLGRFTAPTLRYIKIASDLKMYFGELGSKIAEIGVGYGGQCLILDQIFSWKTYYMFDLDLPLQLTNRYLENFLLNSSYKCTTLNQYSGDEELDLAISTVAFSELPSKLQIKYVEKVLSKAKKGYLIMNSGWNNSFFTGDFLTVDQLRNLLPPFEVHLETPDTLPTNNQVIVWGHKK